MKIAVRSIIVHKGKILLVQHKGRDFFSLPGGKVDDGEGMKEALRRELIEELGIPGNIGNLLFVHEFRYPGGTLSLELFFWVQNAKDFFTAEKLEGELTEEELAKIEWIDITTKPNVMPKFLQEKITTLTGNEAVEYFSDQD